MAWIDQIIMNQACAQRERLEYLRTNGDRIAIFGAGIYGQVLEKYLAALKIPVNAFVVDDEFVATARTASGVPLIPFSHYLNQHRDLKLVVGLTNYPPILRRFAEAGLARPDVIDVPDYLNIPNGFMDYSYVREHASDFERVTNLFFDSASKDSFVALINAKLNLEPAFLLKHVRRDALYFPSREFPIGEDEVFLDVGGFDGDSILDFNAATGGKYRQIVSLEPCSENFAKLESRINEHGLARVSAIRKGAWTHHAHLFVSNESTGIDNQILQSGRESIEVDSIDSILAGSAYRPTLMKLDINGAELAALEGAIETIREARPSIACRLHRKEDYLRIPTFFATNFVGAKLRLRLRCYLSIMPILYVTFEDGAHSSADYS
jgi:FkbM family methyltransferase